LSYKYFGPYSVLERIGKAAYKLALLADSQIHPVFHISQLKSFTPDYTLVYSTLPTLTDFFAASLQPDAILERRIVKKGNAAVPQVLVKWCGLPGDITSWEDWYVLLQKFPSLSSWGQEVSSAGGGVIPDT
jgi:hypothetical protein